jgi:hypothetical protein
MEGALDHSKYRVRKRRVPHHSQYEIQFQAEDPNIIYEVTMPLRPARKWFIRLLSDPIVGSIIGLVFDDGIRHSCDFHGNSGVCFSS